MYVYVIDSNGVPLMPTCKCGKVRILLKEGKAKVIKRTPFTIQLLYETGQYVQPITLGVGAGSKTIGLSASTEKTELYSAEVTLRTDIVDLLSTRRETRRTRRSRLRYRKPRFNNRVKSKKEGWLAPSVTEKLFTHIKVVDDVHKILPISKIVVEVADFDIQKIKNPEIEGAEYQQGEQLDAKNVREYVLFRDNHTCQCCKNKSKDRVLQVHHIESRKTGGNAPNNLVTLCKTCHELYHKGLIKLPSTIKRGASFRDAAFMGIIRWTLYNKLKVMYPDVVLTYGYITKSHRISKALEKTHHADALMISGHYDALPLDYCYYQKKLRCHNRQIHKANKLKGGKLKPNQAPYTIFGFRLFDKVKYKGVECFIKGRRTSGSFALSTLDGTKVTDGVTYKKTAVLRTNKNHYI